MVLRVFVLLLVFTAQAQAGPWPRGKGKVFFSAHINGEYSEDTGLLNQFGTLYIEYGLTDNLTLGVDYSGSEIKTDKAIAFLRIPIANRDRSLRFSAEIGIGLSGSEMAIRPGFSLGRGITWRERNGWITLDTRAVLTGSSRNSRLEADFTFGLSTTERSKVILQLQGGMPSEGDSYLKFAPSLVLQRKPGRFVEIGLVAGLANYKGYGAKIGIWREF